MGDEEKSEGAFAKGDRAAIVSGRKNPIGMRGQVFWTGENKYGEGMRYGLRGDDGVTYWCNEGDLGPEEGAPPPPEIPQGPSETLEKGSRVSIVKGPSAGTEGEVFWVGESRFGNHMRYGIKDEEGETHWADAPLIELLSAPSASSAGSTPSGDGPPMPDDDVAGTTGAPAMPDDVPLPEPDDFAAATDDFAADDIPFDGDDIPF